MARVHHGSGPPPSTKKTAAAQLNQSFYEACGHSSTTSLCNKWHAVSPNKACPVCVVTRITDTIKNVRDEFTKRGGVFMSRGEDWHKPPEHRTLASGWRIAKIHGFKIIDTVEQLTKEKDMEEEDKALFEKALTVWEKEAKRLWKVPGHLYEGDEEDMTDEEKETVRLMMVLLEQTVRKLALELDEEDRRAGRCPQVQQNAQGSTTQDSTRCRNKGAEEIDRVEPAPSMSPTPLLAPRPSPSPVPSEKATPTRSILKRKSPSPGSTSNAPPAPSRSRKRVRTTCFATVSSEHLTISNPSPFYPSSSNITLQPHNPTVDAESKRRKRNFKRASDLYEPGQWASPAFSEKANTSFYKTSWDEAEEITRKEMEEWEEEKKTVEGLKKISGVWVVRWWLGNVVGRVDLERMRANEDEQKALEHLPLYATTESGDYSMQLASFILAVFVALVASCPPPLNRWEYADNTTLLEEAIAQLNQVGDPATGWVHTVGADSPVTTWPPGAKDVFVRIPYCFYNEEAKEELEKRLKTGMKVWRSMLKGESKKVFD
ncbi:hypothetical protein K458DRAFT_433842 [Lentithecium fluviatile CBS 122367]|uniref:Uncharacterized protein n=1 Tax=Lentithecium fluviatile CBS 122367 TaxID=1168545 RepID=A0A6G1IRR5_9PLEO|nr:hypothetical protein K458DRAFT_433842 [Lentithecium fluviatile CBS 122367]